MNLMGIKAIYPRKRKFTSLKESEHKIYPYLLEEYWTHHTDRTKSVYVSKPNEVWSGDITYIRMNGGFMYLAAITCISMNGKGRSTHNIAIERFFRTLKHSNIYINDYKSVSELKEGVREYIYKYNFKRLHLAT